MIVVRVLCNLATNSQIYYQSFTNMLGKYHFVSYQVCDSTSGQELFSLEGGTSSAATFCCFKPTAHSIVGVSDTLVKVGSQALY